MSKLDRVTIIGIEGEATQDYFNRHVPGAVTYFTVWARRIDISLETAHAEGIAREQRWRDWRFRYRIGIANTPMAGLTVMHEEIICDGANMVKVDRRGWIDKQGVYLT